ncbi:MAG: shikimate dehydrogenase [Thermodesulfobacteriota bacterium]|nr:shikimate dehydrogenase [Thermodesulfobacteriota bacterium]
MRTVKSVGTHTKLCAVIGNPVMHSLSPAIHNAAFAELDLDFVYLAFLVEDVKSVLTGMRAMENFRGISITIPHKIEAMKYVDEVAEVDQNIGSINTVINEHGTLVGLGTDGPGALKAMKDAEVTIDDKNILIVGSGGAARAISFTLAQNTKLQELTIVDINEKILKQLTADLTTSTGVRVKSELLTDYSLCTMMKHADVIIHCTPVGMYPNENVSLIPAELFRPEQVVFDIVYTPLETKLIADAKSRGAQVIYGIDMFINQAVLQFEQFTGVDAPVEVMHRVVMEHLES